MPTTLETEAHRILSTAGVETEIVPTACNPGDPVRTDDDTCVIEGRNVRFDDLFSLANSRNLARKVSRELDFRNYFFRLDPNAVFFRRESYDRTNLGEGGLLFRAKGSIAWRKVDYQDILSSPELKAAIVPILLRILQSRPDYERLNGSPHHGDDYAYAQAKAVMWLNEFVPKGDSDYLQTLLKVFPSLTGDAAFFASLRLRQERGDVARENWSLEPTVQPQVAWEMFGAFYAPLPLRLSASGEHEPVGSLVAAGVGAQVCIGPRIDCARREGLRFGALGEAARMLNGFGFWSFGGKIFVGNENIVGFAEVAANMYPTGGFLGEGEPGEFIFKPSLGGGVRVIPHLKYFPLAIPAGFRLDPTEPRNAGVYVGLGGAQ